MGSFRSLYLWACERLYHELAGSYDLISRLVSAGAWPAWRRTVLPHVQGPRVLEIGFGSGELLAELADCGWQVTGLELSPAMQTVAARRPAQRSAHSARAAACVLAPAQAMPFAAAAFDTVVATFPAPYILQPETLAECARVLRPGGRLVVGGLWVRLQNEHLRRALPVFYADPTLGQIEAIAQHVRAAGLHAYWYTAAARWAAVPILIAQLPASGERM